MEPQDKLVRNVGDEHPNSQSAPTIFSYTRASFTTGIVSPGAITKSRPARLPLGHFCDVSSLATVTDAAVSMITRHGFSCIQPLAIRLSSVRLAGIFVTFFLAGTNGIFKFFYCSTINCNVASIMIPTSDTNCDVMGGSIHGGSSLIANIQH
jgi:hypothetical protein